MCAPLLPRTEEEDMRVLALPELGLLVRAWPSPWILCAACPDNSVYDEL